MNERRLERAHLAAVVLCPVDDVDEKEDLPATGPAAPIAGVPMLSWVIDAVVAASIRRVSIVGLAPSSKLRDEVAVRTDRVIVDPAPFVSSGAVEMIARAVERLGLDGTVNDNANLLVVRSDTPQVSADVLRSLIEEHLASEAAATALVTGEPRAVDPVVGHDETGAVDVILDSLAGSLPGAAAVVCIRASLLVPALRRVTPLSWDDDPLIDDALAALEEAGHSVRIASTGHGLVRVRSPHDRVAAETEIRDRILRRWLDRGVHITDPRQVSVDGTVELGRGVRLMPGTVLEGSTVVGDDAVLGPNTHVVDATIGAGVHAPNAAIYDTDIAPHTRLSPFSVHRAPGHH